MGPQAQEHPHVGPSQHHHTPAARRPPSCAPAPPPCRPGAWRGAAVVGAGLRAEPAGEVPYANLDHAASTPALDGQGSGRPGARDLLVGPPRRRPRLPADEHLVRAGPRRGRRLRRGPPDTRGGLHARSTTDSWACCPRRCRAARRSSSSAPSTTRRCSRGAATARCAYPSPRRSRTRFLLDERSAERPSRHRLVVVAGASNVTGEIWPVERFARLAHDHGARIAVDAASSPPTARSTSPPGTRTTSRSPGTRPTPRTARRRRPTRLARRRHAVPLRWRRHEPR